MPEDPTATTNDETARLRLKLDQAETVIRHLLAAAGESASEAQRALDYFSGKRVDADFLPWPRRPAESLRPEELNAANDD